MRTFRPVEEMFIALTIHDALNTMMNVKECAKFCKVTEKTVWNWIDSGEIMATQKGKLYSIPKLQFYEELIERLEKRVNVKLTERDALMRNVQRDIIELAKRIA